MPRHEFGIIDVFFRPEHFSQQYEPEKYHCIAIDDEYIEQLCQLFGGIKTYFPAFAEPQQGLAYCGITLIPPESLAAFKAVFAVQNDPVYEETLQLLDKAMAEQKYVIHYGI